MSDDKILVQDRKIPLEAEVAFDLASAKTFSAEGAAGNADREKIKANRTGRRI
jgi:hypothetical protein